MDMYSEHVYPGPCITDYTYNSHIPESILNCFHFRLTYKTWKQQFDQLIMCHLPMDGQMGEGVRVVFHFINELNTKGKYHNLVSLYTFYYYFIYIQKEVPPETRLLCFFLFSSN